MERNIRFPDGSTLPVNGTPYFLLGIISGGNGIHPRFNTEGDVMAGHGMTPEKFNGFMADIEASKKRKSDSDSELSDVSEGATDFQADL